MKIINKNSEGNVGEGRERSKKKMIFRFVEKV